MNSTGNITDQRESLLLAPYAMHSAESAGREYNEPLHPYRGPYQRDRDRIVHSSAYRRLADKTQVFTGEQGNYHRTRLTHTLEVASIARTVGRVLQLNEDLIEALALMHDIGHPPFGHAGEDILDECTADYGGFNHNRQAVRIVTKLEYRYPEFPGLNLSRELLSGQLARVKDASHQNQPILEVQVVNAADSIAYDSHDADDALELGLLTLEDLLSVPLWKEAARQTQETHRALDAASLRRAVIRQLIDDLVSDLVATTRNRLETANINSAECVTQHDERIVAPSEGMFKKKAALETYLFDHVYRHPTVLAKRALATDALRKMFQHFVQAPATLPLPYLAQLKQEETPRVVCDYLAALTDRAALDLYGNGLYGNQEAP